MTNKYPVLFEKSNFKEGACVKVVIFDDPILMNLVGNNDILDIFALENGCGLT